MNPLAILGVIGSLYAELDAAQQRVKELEAQVAELEGDDG